MIYLQNHPPSHGGKRHVAKHEAVSFVSPACLGKASTLQQWKVKRSIGAFIKMNRLFIIVYPLLQGRGVDPPKIAYYTWQFLLRDFFFQWWAYEIPEINGFFTATGDQVGSRTESLGISEVFFKCWFPSCCENWHLHWTPNTASFMLLFWGYILKHTHTHISTKKLTKILLTNH